MMAEEDNSEDEIPNVTMHIEATNDMLVVLQVSGWDMDPNC